MYLIEHNFVPCTFPEVKTLIISLRNLYLNETFSVPTGRKMNNIDLVLNFSP